MEQYSHSARKTLVKLLKQCDFPTDDVEVAFLTRCQGGQDLKAQIKEAERCRPLLDALLERVSPSAILIPMGATACKVVAKQKSILMAHGAVLEVNGHVCVPTLQPTQVIAYPDSLATFVADLQKIQDAGAGKIAKPMSTNHLLVDSISKFKKMVFELWNSKSFSFDIESSSLNPFRSKPHPAKVEVIAFSNKAGKAWVVPVDHKDSPWTKEQHSYIIRTLRSLFETTHIRKIAHNGQFDTMYIRKVLKIRVAKFDFDTLLAHHIGVTEEKGTHGLKILAWEYTDMGGYDDALDAYKASHPEADPDQGGSYGNIPLDILWTYAAADADVTYRVYEKLQPIIDEGFKDVFYKVVMPATRALADLYYTGAPIDRDWHKHCKTEYERLLDEELTRLREFPEVLQIENEITKTQIKKKKAERKARFEKRFEEIQELEQVDPDKASTKLRRLRGDIERAKLKPVTVKPVTFNPKSTHQKRRLLFELLGFEPIKLAKSGKSPSTDKETMKSLWFEHKHDIIMGLGRYIKMSTLYSMFVKNLDDMICDDGRLRGSCNVAGTETGRLSMSNPNLQQIPKNLKADPREPFVDGNWPSIKKMFAAIPGYAIVQFDYSQAELRVLAALTRDPVLMKAYQDGEDIHRRAAAEAFNVAIEDVTDYQRNVAKTINFGLVYGQGPRKLAKTIGCSVEEAKEFIRIYFKRFKRVKIWINNTKKLVREQGYIDTPYGRRRRLASVFSPEEDIVAKAERQGVNSPIQATASDWTLQSIASIRAWLIKNKMQSKIILTVHDSIILLVKMEEMEAVCDAVKRIMENPPHDGWLDGVPVVADCSIGKNWGQLKDVKKLSELPVIVEEVWKQAA